MPVVIAVSAVALSTLLLFDALFSVADRVVAKLSACVAGLGSGDWAEGLCAMIEHTKSTISGFKGIIPGREQKRLPLLVAGNARSIRDRRYLVRPTEILFWNGSSKA